MDLRNFHVTFAIGIVETQLHTTIEKICPKRTEYSVGYSNIKQDPLIDLIKILLPPLRLNLGFIEQLA